MTFYSDMADTATELLTEFGTSIVFTRRASTFDPVTGSESAITDTPTTCTGVVLNRLDEMVGGVRVMSGDRMLVIDDTYAPAAGDKVTLESGSWAVAAIETINPGGTVVAYRVLVRR